MPGTLIGFQLLDEIVPNNYAMRASFDVIIDVEHNELVFFTRAIDHNGIRTRDSNRLTNQASGFRRHYLYIVQLIKRCTKWTVAWRRVTLQ